MTISPSSQANGAPTTKVPAQRKTMPPAAPHALTSYAAAVVGSEDRVTDFEPQSELIAIGKKNYPKNKSK